MSFQGDVAGIGLGELLQGLARGGREGVLTLNGGGLVATLGLHGGQIFLLPEPDEDPESWRKRCERAWIKDPNQRIDVLRMSEIAYAARLENLFALLDCQGVHFRFEPGPIPIGRDDGADTEVVTDRSEELREGARSKLEIKTPVHCPGVSVEFLLLEYARMADESQRHGDSTLLSPDDVPRILLDEPPARELERFWMECDGASTILEISDRLGWPLRQARAIVQELGTGGAVRLSDARELLAMVQRELSATHYARAAARMCGWCRCAPPGPPHPGDAELLRSEWAKGRLPLVLAHMNTGDARTLLRRLEFGEADPQASLERWQEMRQSHKHDTVSELHVVRLQLARTSDGKGGPSTDLLKIARNFQEAGLNMRAAVILRTAADCMPDSTPAKLELGTRMLAIGMVEEAAPWVVEASRSLIEQGNADKAVQPLRSLLSADPHNREAKELLTQARAKSAKGRLRRRNTLIALAVLLLLSLGAMVRMHFEQEYDRRLTEVTDQIDRPEVALALLDQNFVEDDNARVRALRATLQERLRNGEVSARNVWLEKYREGQLECALGDPLLGLRRALELPLPPKTKYTHEPFPPVADLYESLAGRLEQDIAEAAKEDTLEAAHAEKKLLRMATEMQALLEGRTETNEALGFDERLKIMISLLSQRDEQRALEREERENSERIAQQDQLLGIARAHYQAGDLERSVQFYRKLTAMQGGDLIRQAFAKEINEVEAHYEALTKAQELAGKGKHSEALAALQAACPDPREHPLPWTIDSLPTGARVRFSDGSSRVTPFTFESGFGELIEMTLELAGHESFTVTYDAPSDRRIVLSRSPVRTWRSERRVEAPPVSVGDDHIVCDRAGNVVRLAPDGRALWNEKLMSLGGIGRAPVFLAGKPGSLLLVTEDGAAWIIDAANGDLDGPHGLNSPPVEGPIATPTGVRARFADGRLATWRNSVGPVSLEIAPNEPLGETPALAGSDAGLQVLRRTGSLERTMKSPWVGWEVAIDGELLDVHPSDSDALERGFHVRLSGEWLFLAWEAPNSKIPLGRLWVSDSQGLRAFEP